MIRTVWITQTEVVAQDSASPPRWPNRVAADGCRSQRAVTSRPDGVIPQLRAQALVRGVHRDAIRAVGRTRNADRAVHEARGSPLERRGSGRLEPEARSSGAMCRIAACDTRQPRLPAALRRTLPTCL